MEDFGFDRPQLSGSMLSFDFTSTGRIQQLWVVNSEHDEAREEVPFALPQVAFGEESSHNYLPGTLLISARLSPNEPWISSRGAGTHQSSDDDDDEDMPTDESKEVSFDYEFPLLPEVTATGKFSEQKLPIGAVAWDIELTNVGDHIIEIGELGFPLALNNFYDGVNRGDVGMRELFVDRLYLHRSINGAASYLHACRLNSEPPGLLIVPGEESEWEFSASVPGSLATPWRWEGIPVVYALSKATIEREGWGPWFNGHSSHVLEPGDTYKHQILFLPTDRYQQDSVTSTLITVGRPALRLYPAAVVPFDVGIGLEVLGATPTQFKSTVTGHLETDSDDGTGFCYLRPDEPGSARLTVKDTEGRESYAHLRFTPPLADLIQKRAEWICAHQVLSDGASNLNSSLVPYDLAEDTQVTDQRIFGHGFGVLTSLADAVFLSEANLIFPKADQIQILNKFVKDYLRDDVQNPGDASVGSVLNDTYGVASGVASPAHYSLVVHLYRNLYELALGYNDLEFEAEFFLSEAARTLKSMLAHCFGSGLPVAGLIGVDRLNHIAEDLAAAGRWEEGVELSRMLGSHFAQLSKRQFPFSGESGWTMDGFEEAYWAYRETSDEESMDWMLRYVYAGRSLAPCWWWYANDKRFLEDHQSPHPIMIDKGELCLGPSTSANSLLYFHELGRDYRSLNEQFLRSAMGGLLAPWALVNADGSASAGFCPDLSSKQNGPSWCTGDVSLTLWHYLRGAGAWVLPSAENTFTFGCTFEAGKEDDKDIFTVLPWDGIGRFVIVRQIGLEVHVKHCRIQKLQFDSRKRWAKVTLENPSDKTAHAKVLIKGLWGSKYVVLDNELTAENAELRFGLELKPGQTGTIYVKEHNE